MLNILLAEDHTIVRNGIKVLLEKTGDINVVGECVNGLQVLDKIKSGVKVDIVLTDINMEEMDGIALTRELHNLNPEIVVVILSMYDNEKYIIESFAEGAAGYLLKNVSAEEMLFCLNFVVKGNKYLCMELTEKLIKNFTHPKNFTANSNETNLELSVRELEVLRLIADGLTNGEVSEKLFISKRTVEGHRQSLIEKTNSKNTATLIRFAILNGLID